ncbi:MAG: YdeI/OmpD-associated family protein [Chitinophagaceae bacterium]|nr:YdeI/OmpD-associated family protein [Chitinophagaceae bacterium]
MAQQTIMATQYILQKPAKGYMHYIQLSQADVKRLTTGGNKRIICSFNDQYRIHAAIMRTKEGMNYVMIGSQHLKALQLRAGSVVKLTLKKDDTELQFSVPEEFAEVLATDPAAEKYSIHSPQGNKRGLIALVNMVKSSDKKIERSLLIAEKLKKGSVVLLK